LPYYDDFWRETRTRYQQEKRIDSFQDVLDQLGIFIHGTGGLLFEAEPGKHGMVSETDDSETYVDGNGNTWRKWKGRSGTPEHVAFAVTTQSDWERAIKPRLLSVDKRRYNVENYREERERALRKGYVFYHSLAGPFELMHQLLGHESLLVATALEPEWVKDMVNTYVDLLIMHMDALYADAGLPDFFLPAEDLGFKEHPFVSPAMYEELLQPGHRKLFGYAHDRGLKVMVHSCGYVAPLVAGLVEAGMDCLQAMEFKAGMDIAPLASAFGDRISFCGNVDARVLISNDRNGIEAELQRVLAPIREGKCRYILHSDHSIPPEVEYDTMEFFFKRGQEIYTGRH
jgi:uroporphyrinogen decarboxylase